MPDNSIGEDDLRLYLLNADIDPGVAAQLKSVLSELEVGTNKAAEAADKLSVEWLAAQANILEAQEEQRRAMESAMAEETATLNVLTAAAQKYGNTLNEVGGSSQKLMSLKEIAQAMDQGWKQADDSFFKYSQDVQQWINQQPVEGGGFRPLQIQALPTAGGEDEGSAGGGGGRSLFGIGHALSVAGHSLGSPALREAGGLVYIEEGLKRALPLLQDFNAEIEKAPGILGPAVSGLTSLGVPLAGLAAVAVPVAAAVVAVTLAWNHFNQVVGEGQGLLHHAIEETDAYYKAIENGTTESLQKEIEAQTVRRNSALREYNDLSVAVQGSGGKLDVLNAAVKGAGLMFGSFNEAYDKLKQLGAEGDKAQAIIEGDTRALKSNGVAFNDAAEAARKNAAAMVETAQRYAQYDALTVQGVQDRLSTLQREGATAEAAKAALEAQNDVLRSGTDQYNKNVQAIQGYQAVIDQSKNDILHLTLVSLGLAQARKEESDAMAAEQAILQERLSFFNQVGRLRATGTQAAYDSMVGGLQGKKEGDLSEINYLEGKGSLTDDEQKLLVRLKAEVEEIDKQLDFLNYDVRLWVEAREAASAIHKADAALAKETAAAEKEAKDKTAESIRREKQAEEEYTRGSLQDTEARHQIELKLSRDETKLKQDTADKILDITEKLHQQTDDAYTSLRRKQEDDLVKYQNDQAKLVRDAQNQATEDAIEHSQRLKEIQQQSFNDDQQALIDRNFAQLAKNHLKDQQAIDKENESYNQREQKLSRHLQRQEEELAIRLRQEQAQEQVALRRKIEDLERAANREIEQTNQTEERKRRDLLRAQQQQIEDLNHNEDYKIRLLRHNQAIELQLIADQEKQRITIANATNAAIIDRANRMLDSIYQHQPGAVDAVRGSGEQRSRYAAGTPYFGAGRAFEMSELEPETLNIGRNSYVIPGQAIVYPFQSGSVSTNSGGSKTVTLAPTFNIYERDNIDRVREEILTMLEAVG